MGTGEPVAASCWFIYIAANNNIMPITARNLACSDKMSMPWLYFLTFYNDMFIQFGPSKSTQKQTENIKSKRQEEAT